MSGCPSVSFSSPISPPHTHTHTHTHTRTHTHTHEPKEASGGWVAVCSSTKCSDSPNHTFPRTKGKQCMSRTFKQLVRSEEGNKRRWYPPRPSQPLSSFVFFLLFFLFSPSIPWRRRGKTHTAKGGRRERQGHPFTHTHHPPTHTHTHTPPSACVCAPTSLYTDADKGNQDKTKEEEEEEEEEETAQASSLRAALFS